jgi:AcrR family transcriptional regulator
MRSPSEDATARPRPGRAPERRNQQARAAILHAADDLLAEHGFDKLTIEGIAARAGVAKQTIYRWWPSKVEVLLDTLHEDAESHLAVSEHESVRAQLRQRLRHLAKFLQKDHGQVLLALIGEAQHDQQTADRLQQEFFSGQLAADHARLQRGIASGELPPELPIDETLDALYGPIYFRALVTHQPVKAAFIDGLLERALGAESQPKPV